MGSMDISCGIVATTSPLAVHIACDVGNRVHTRNDSDEDVRGNAYKQTIAWKALPWSFIMSHTDNTEHTDLSPVGSIACVSCLKL